MEPSMEPVGVLKHQINIATIVQLQIVFMFVLLTIIDLGPDTILICAGTSETLDAGSDLIYTWSDASTLQTLDVSSAGTYKVTAIDANGCSVSDIAIDILNIDITQNDTTICEGDSLVLSVGTPQDESSKL